MTATIFIDHQQLPTFWCLPLHFLTNRKKKLAPSKITNERNKKKGGEPNNEASFSTNYEKCCRVGEEKVALMLLFLLLFYNPTIHY